ncbi:MAG: hypothetical protein JNK85_13870 [Verrucomicrobiales bacterium]|nr:hypothetical protein [Verrucomicrobiales bacterium]
MLSFAKAGSSLLLIAWAAVAAGCAGRSGGNNETTALRKALTFHASFDRGSDADYAQADAWLYHAPAMEKWSEARPGLPSSGNVRVVPGEGRFGGALRFDKRADPVVFYRGQQNVPWTAQSWSGSVSVWLRADFAELAKGYCDPVQITPRAWNDAAFFLEFEKRDHDVPFRLGAYADLKVWNPLNRDWGTLKPFEKPLITVDGPPFSRERWTHVVFTWQRFNTGSTDGVALLYLDGAQVGAIRDFTQTFTWNPTDLRLLLGVGYIGWMDEVAVFNRTLTPHEVQVVRQLPRGIRSLHE